MNKCAGIYTVALVAAAFGLAAVGGASAMGLADTTDDVAPRIDLRAAHNLSSPDHVQGLADDYTSDVGAWGNAVVGDATSDPAELVSADGLQHRVLYPLKRSWHLAMDAIDTVPVVVADAFGAAAEIAFQLGGDIGGPVGDVLGDAHDTFKGLWSSAMGLPGAVFDIVNEVADIAWAFAMWAVETAIEQLRRLPP